MVRQLRRPHPPALVFLLLLTLCWPPLARAAAAETATAETDRKAAEVIAAVVGIRAEIPADARTADTLGTERPGSGIVIDEEGHVVTIGYLILESAFVEIIRADGQRVPADVVGYDSESGFGLIKALQPLGVQPLPLGDSTTVGPGDDAIVISAREARLVQPVSVVSRRDFAGSWEYLLPNAIFTAPPHQFFGGAALVSRDGALLGIGSLIVPDAPGEGVVDFGNMFVPVERLQPILADLIATGRSKLEPRPWLGLYADEGPHGLVVSQVAEGGPADSAGVHQGDTILRVAGQAVSGLAEFYRAVWGLGAPGVDVPLAVRRGGGTTTEELRVHSADRYEWLRLDPSF
jgi:S1-C subfamily serine protease